MSKVSTNDNVKTIGNKKSSGNAKLIKQMRKVQEEYQKDYEIEIGARERNEPRKKEISGLIFDLLVANHFDFGKYFITEGAILAFISYAKMLDYFTNAKDVGITAEEMEKIFQKIMEEKLAARHNEKHGSKKTDTEANEDKNSSPSSSLPVSSESKNESMTVTDNSVENDNSSERSAEKGKDKNTTSFSPTQNQIAPENNPLPQNSTKPENDLSFQNANASETLPQNNFTSENSSDETNDGYMQVPSRFSNSEETTNPLTNGQTADVNFNDERHSNNPLFGNYN